MSNRFTSKSPSTPQGKRGRLRKTEEFIKEAICKQDCGKNIPT